MESIKLLNITIPLIIALMSLVLLLLHLLSNAKKQAKNFTKTIGLYFIFSVLNWGILLLFYTVPKAFVLLNSVFFLTLMLVHVFFYKFLWVLTNVNSNHKFSKWHFAFPFLGFLVLSFLMLITPYKEQLTYINDLLNFGNIKYSLFSILSSSKFPIRIVFSIVYTVLSIIKLLKYRKVIYNYSSNHSKSSLKWLNLYFYLSIHFIIVPFLVTFDLLDINSVYFLIFTLVFGFQYVLLAWNTIQENYLLLENDKVFEITPNTDENRDNLKKLKGSKKITKEAFERMMEKERPYLNADIRLNDIALLMNTNRSYLSSFINNEYEVNFNILINNYRFEEYNRLKETNANNNTEKELIEKAGFGNHRNFKNYCDNNSFD